MSTLSELSHRERIQRLRELINRLRGVARDGHIPYILDAIEMIVDDLDRDNQSSAWQLDTLDRSHKDLAHRLAQSGRDNERLTAEIARLKEQSSNG